MIRQVFSSTAARRSSRTSRVVRLLGYVAVLGLAVSAGACGSARPERVDVAQLPEPPSTTSDTTTTSSSTTTAPPATTSTTEPLGEEEQLLDDARGDVVANVARFGRGEAFADCLLAEAGERWEGGNLGFAVAALAIEDPASVDVEAQMEVHGLDVGALVRVDQGLASSWRACSAAEDPDPGPPVSEPPRLPFGFPEP